MIKQLDLIDNHSSIENLPSAKVRTKDKEGVHGWTNFYASYSENFVSSVIDALGIKDSSIILDPFVGAGTTLIVAKKHGIKAIGIDIDPFSCLLTRSKLATDIDLLKVATLLKPTKSKKISASFSQDAIQLFDEECLVYATAVFERIKKSVGGDNGVLEKILACSNEFDSEVIALTALCIGASESAKLTQGSNPTWFRKVASGEENNAKALFQATHDVKNRITSDIFKMEYTSQEATIHLADTRHNASSLSNVKADYIITSPPYLTRIDYAMKHFPYLAILSGFYQFDFDNLRKKMIGTPKIVDKSEVEQDWGTLCLEVLKKIKEHPSYASESYYVWTYHQYFKSLFQTFFNFKKLLNKNGEGVIVLQDSFYKDIHIPLSDIAVEMLIKLGFEARVIQKDLVKTNMKQLNPAHQSKKISQKASEDVIYLKLI